MDNRPFTPVIRPTLTTAGFQRRALSRIPWLRGLVFSRWPIFTVRAVTLAGFILTILAGLFGSVVGSHNFAIIFVWIAWWTLLKLVFIPLGGRSWCAVCPIPMPGEWLTQGSIFPVGEHRGVGLGRKWPVNLRLPRLGTFRLRGTWLQAGGFLLIGLFSAVTLTTPSLTGWVLLVIFVLSAALSLIFDRPGQPTRPFCNSLCPIGGFTGLYAQAAPLEIRVDDPQICAAHSEKTCYEHCPWGVYIAAVRENSPCGLCMECIRVCPNDNVSLNLRAFGRDLIAPLPELAKPAGSTTPCVSSTSTGLPTSAPRPLAARMLRLDEAYLALVMLGCALTFSAVFLGAWGGLRRAAYAVGTPAWFAYAAAFLVFAGLLVPGLYALAVRLGGPSADFPKALGRYARPLLPLGLLLWIAFTVAFAFAKISYVLPVVADPFGLGWNLFGAAGVVIDPDVSVFSPLLQSALLLGGLVWAGSIARRDADTPRRALFLQVYALLLTVSMLFLLVG